LHHHADAHAPDAVRRHTADRFAGERHGSGRWSLETGDRLQQRALSRSVRADDGDDLAVVDPERDPVDGRDAAEVLRYRIGLEESRRRT
jgi:hypothetical protein